MRFFVTGASGFVGRHLVPALAREGTVEVLHRPGLAVPPHLRGVRLHRGDLLRPKTLSPAARADVLYHLAAQASPRQSEAQPGLALRTNALGTLNLLDALGARPRGRFVLMSSGQVYEPSPGRRLTESSPVRGRSVYAMSKLAAESLVQHAATLRGIEDVIVRSFNLYGPGQGPEYIVPTILRQVVAGRDVRIRSGRPIRDFTYIADAVDFLLRAATRRGARGRVLNLASGSSVTIRHVAQQAIRAAGKRLRIVETGAPPRHDTVRVDVRRARRLLAWRTRTALPEGLRLCLQDMRRT